jgi:hypothetical protein
MLIKNKEQLKVIAQQYRAATETADTDLIETEQEIKEIDPGFAIWDDEPFLIDTTVCLMPRNAKDHTNITRKCSLCFVRIDASWKLCVHTQYYKPESTKCISNFITRILNTERYVRIKAANRLPVFIAGFEKTLMDSSF